MRGGRATIGRRASRRAFGREALLVSDAPFEGGVPTAPAAAAKKLAWHIDNATRKRKAVTFWGRWKTPEVVKEYQPFGVTGEAEEVQAALRDAQGIAEVRLWGPGDPSLSCFNGGFSWRFDQDTPLENVLLFYAMLDRWNVTEEPSQPWCKPSVEDVEEQENLRVLLTPYRSSQSLYGVNETEPKRGGASDDRPPDLP